MLLLLPPSETKRDGGDGAALDLASLAFPRLSPRRRELIRAVRTLAKDADAMAAALKLGPKQRGEVERNRTLTASPTLPALDRFTGVLYDTLDAPSLPPAARERAGESVVVASALFGLVGGLDRIPAYRLSADSRLPGVALRAHWSDRVGRELAAVPGLVLDLRSESYAALGPAPRRPGSVYLRVLGEGPGGAVRALNHFNKRAKGELTRALLTAPELPASVEDLLDWAPSAGFRLAPGAPGELALTVGEPAAAPR
ncbi:YaaA family protein [Naasia sp. SYSU D00057]|uniref:YaaA family protein n=1 Tax=Naasia sp. SYSU D00057 TaxID=2817380 RepID=UPI001B315B87|nr:peroxide stress protein YaaA [Naasia sp. SYSU D00057]